MLKEFLMTAAVIFSTSYGATLPEIPDIQDPEFSWKGLGLSPLSSDNTPPLDFQGISQRSLRADVAELDSLCSNLKSIEGWVSEPVVNKLSELLLILHSEALAAHKLIVSKVITQNATQDTIIVLQNVYYMRILLLQQCISKLEQAIKNIPKHSSELEALLSPLSTSFTKLMQNDPTEILGMTINKGSQ